MSSRPHLLLGALAERRFGGLRVFINAENLLDVRQTKYDPLIAADAAAATAAGPSMRGRRSKGASSTAACAWRSSDVILRVMEL